MWNHDQVGLPLGRTFIKKRVQDNHEISSETSFTNSSKSEGSENNGINCIFNQNSEQVDENSRQSSFIENAPLVNWSKYKTTVCQFIIEHQLENQSLTTQFFPSTQDSTNYKIMVGTNLTQNNKLYILTYRIPNGYREYERFKFENKKTVKISYKLDHKSEINRARVDESNPDIFATKAGNGMVYIYSLSRHNNNPVLTCRGHTKEGYGISWNPFRQGFLLSGGYDHKICIWDITKAESSEIDPIHQITKHSNIVEDVQWCPNNTNVFASVGDDKKMIIFDDRTCKPEISIRAHEKEVNSVAFHKKFTNFLITGSSDNTIRLWDIRSSRKHLHSFEAHDKPVYSVQWNPHNNNIFGSSGDDSRFHIWDINKIGVEGKGRGLMNQPTELIFTNSGHNSSIRDFDWCPNLPWTISTVDDNKINQIWSVKKKIIYQDECLLDDEKIEI
ncbi:wd40 repeat family [Anaeramoeba flamelloides]|uniref:Wd40 repeat family n=1 Tax=Anaeramoeba flamelloides TaxID=1746091 RepID=A0AAV7ZZF2_9EUKA|nr:wd40 repeat family [Anaeramoeba flamelloides]